VATTTVSVTKSSADDEWLDVLRDMGDEQLAALLRARPDLASPEPGNLSDLSGRMREGASLRRFHSGCDLGSQQVIEVLCLLDSPAKVSLLAGTLGCAPEALAPVLDRLATAGVVRVDETEIRRIPGLTAAFLTPCGLGPPLRSLLEHRPGRELETIAHTLGVAGKGTKAVVVERLVTVLTDSARLRSLLASAPKEAAGLLRSASTEWPHVQFSYPVEYVFRRADTVSGWCLQRALIVGSGMGSAVMPREIALALRGGKVVERFSPHAPLVPTMPIDQRATDERAAERALRLVGDVAGLCESWSAAPAKSLKSGGLGVRELRRAAALLDRTEPEAARLVELAAMAGLVDEDDVAGLIAPTAEFDRWWSASRPSRWLHLAAAWLSAPWHLSIAGALDRDGKAIPPLSGREITEEIRDWRVLAMECLAEGGAGMEAERAALVRAVLWRRPGLWAASGSSFAAGLVDELLGESALLGISVGGATSTFGRALLAGREAEAGERLAGLLPPLVDSFILQADLTATCPGEPDPALRSEMDVLADVESTGHATVWRFSEATLRRAFDAGRTADAIVAYLEQHASKEVPQSLAFMVQDVARRHGKVRLGPAACYLRSDDASLLAEIVRTKRLARLRLRLIVPTVAVAAKPPGDVADALRGAGYLPAEEEADASLKLVRPAVQRVEQSAKVRPGFSLASSVGRQPKSDAELVALVARLRAPVRPVSDRPVSATAKPAPRGLPSGGRHDSPRFGYEESSERPSHIARDGPEITYLLGLAEEEGWAVRLSYAGSGGPEREFYAEVVDVDRVQAWVNDLESDGAAALVLSRINWVRVATEAEEEGLGFL
jgi:hypothetical protein